MASNAPAYIFLDEVDTLKCLICLEVARDPQQHDKCGKIFCRRGLEGVILALTADRSLTTLMTSEVSHMYSISNSQMKLYTRHYPACTKLPQTKFN